MEYVLLVWLCCGLLGWIVGFRRNAALAGLVLGILFGPLGVVAAFALDSRPQCPYCKGRLDGRGILCQFCGGSLSEHWTLADDADERLERLRRQQRRG